MSVMIESGLDISQVITHRLGVEDFQQGFDAMNAGEASKVILNWE
jgi:threonine 3-dehydrogenase